MMRVTTANQSQPEADDWLIYVPLPTDTRHDIAEASIGQGGYQTAPDNDGRSRTRMHTAFQPDGGISSISTPTGTISVPVESASPGSDNKPDSRPSGNGPRTSSRQQRQAIRQRPKQVKEQISALEAEVEEQLASLEALRLENSALRVKERALRAMCETSTHINQVAQQLVQRGLVSHALPHALHAHNHEQACMQHGSSAGSSEPRSRGGSNSAMRSRCGRSDSSLDSAGEVSGCLGHLQLPLPRATTLEEISVLRKAWVIQALDTLLLVDSEQSDPALVDQLTELHTAVEAQVYDYAVTSYWTRVLAEGQPSTQPIMEYDDPGDGFWKGIVCTMKFTAEQEQLLMACFDVYCSKMDKLLAKRKEAAGRLQVAMANMPALVVPDVASADAQAELSTAMCGMQAVLKQQLHLTVATSLALDHFVEPLQRVRACCFSHPIWTWMLMVVDTFVKHYDELTCTKEA